MGAILSFFFPPADTAPDTGDTKEDESGVKEVEKEVDSEKADTKKTPEMTDATVTVPKITEEAMEEADYEVVETKSIFRSSGDENSRQVHTFGFLLDTCHPL